MSRIYNQRKVTAWLILLTFLFTCIVPTGTAIAEENTADTRIADPTTLDSWQDYFGDSDTDFTTRYAGHVWTDKSVMTDATALQYATELHGSEKIRMNPDDKNNFLVALSAMSASEAITGESNQPTDTMLILDISSSMYPSRDPSTVSTMVDAVNKTIRNLQALNEHNRVGVTIYYGDETAYKNSDSGFSKILLPLDRYKPVDGEFITITKSSSGKLQSVRVKSGVKTSTDGAVTVVTHNVKDVAGTYAQLGILDALKEFQDEYKNGGTVVNANGISQTRLPIFVFMSDGEPTAGSNIFYQKSDAVMGWNRVVDRNPNETDFVTQLTAAYAKRKVDEWYADTTPLFYTLSLGNSVSLNVMDPNNNSTGTIDNYWNTLMRQNSVRIPVKCWHNGTTENYTVNRYTEDSITYPVSAEDRKYVDKAFTAANAGTLADAFNAIYAEINLQTHTYPTLVEDDENLDGYVSFVDKVGKYMNVTDVKGVLLGTHWYSGRELSKNFVAGGGLLGTTANPTDLGDELVWAIEQRLNIGLEATRTLISKAYQHGQLSYSGNSYSNYFGWYADAGGNYLGFWHEGTTEDPANAVFKNKSYLYLGEVDEAHGIDEADMMYTTVRVSENIATGEQTVAFAVPAALIPMVEYDVELDENGTPTSLTRSGATKPIRLVYEVALDDDINELTLSDPNVVDAAYVTANKDADGFVNFYTNQYEADNSVGYGKVNTYSYFRPAHTNENYYYQENTIVYSDSNGTEYAGSSEPSGTYYREVEVYTKSGNSISMQTDYHVIDADVLQYAVQENGTWYIPKGTVYENMTAYAITKGPNLTETLHHANQAYVDVHNHHANEVNHRFVVGDTLGNNGKVRLKASAWMKITKDVKDVPAGTDLSNETFNFVITGGTAGEYDAIRVAADGTEKPAEKVTFSQADSSEPAKATVSLKAYESLYIKGLTSGTVYTVTETEDAGYILSKVEVDNVAVNDTTATVAPETGKIHEAKFTNVPRGKGALTIAKLVEVPEGVTRPNKKFTINVEFEGVAVDANGSFKAKRTGSSAEETVQLVNSVAPLTLRHGESIEIFDIPEGTKATVREQLNPIEHAGFTASYKVNDVLVENGSNAVVEVVKAPTIDTVTIVNTYNPTSAQVKINLSGKKTLLDGDGNVIQPKDWDDLEFKFIIQRYVYKNGQWQWENTEDVVTVTQNTTGSVIDFEPNGEILTFDKPGTYGYQVIEENHGLTIKGITYDATMHTFNVIVTDDGTGQLKAEVKSSHGTNNFKLEGDTWVNNEIDFTNTNKQGHTSALIMIKKELDNPSNSTEVSLEGYQFDLLKLENGTHEPTNVTITPTDASGETYVMLEYDYADAGEHKYRLKEKASNIPGMTDSKAVYDFTVKVTANQDGSVDRTITGDLGEFIGAETGYNYKLATFKNVYNPTDAEVTLNVTKKLENRTLEAGEFEFQLKQNNAQNNALVKKVSNDAFGIVDFGELTFDKVGTYHYTVSEVIPDNPDPNITYDGTVYNVVIEVTDNNGELEANVDVLNIPNEDMVFTNTYIPPEVSVEIKGDKTLWDKRTQQEMDVENNQFTFKLAESDAAGKQGGVQYEAKNNANGEFLFDELKFNTTGSFYYVLYEDIPPVELQHGITYDLTRYLVSVTVGYDESTGMFFVTGPSFQKIQDQAGNAVNVIVNANEIAFVNEYGAKATDFAINGTKVLTGKNLKDAPAFEFKLYESDDSWIKGKLLDIQNNQANGSFTFEFKETDGYFTSPGVYRYIITETNQGEEGYTYDDKEIGVTVTVQDDMLGQLFASASYLNLYRMTSDGQEVVNTYPASQVQFFNRFNGIGELGEIQVEKKVQGDAPDGSIFGFELNVKAMKPDWSASEVWELMQLEEKHEKALEEQKLADAAWKAATDNFMANAKQLQTSSSAIMFAVMVGETTSPSGYQYKMIDAGGTISATTSSAYDFDGHAIDRKDGHIVAHVIEVIKELAEKVETAGDELLTALQTKLNDMKYALGFRQDDAQNLLDTADRLFAADKSVADTGKAVDEYRLSPDVTTATAVTLVITDAEGKESRKKVDIKDYDKNGVYRYGFTLKDSENYKFKLEATTGSSIDYWIKEVSYPTTNYIRTDIDLNGDRIVDDGLETGKYTLDMTLPYAFLFTNIYDSNGGGGGDNPDPYIDRFVKKVWVGDIVNDRPTSITVQILADGEVDRTVTLNADNNWQYKWTTINDGTLWTVKEIDIPEGYTSEVTKDGTTWLITNTLDSSIPENDPDPDPEKDPDPTDNPGEKEEPGTVEPDLGDAPDTGDHTNAVPFVVLLVIAMAGLVITRRKFN